jgi:hypothetical protein
MLISIYGNSPPSPRTVVSPIKKTRSCLLRKSSTAISSSSGAPNWSGIIAERNVDNSLLRNYFIHLWTHTVFEFTQYLRHTASKRGEDTLPILVSNLLYTFFHLSSFFLVSSFSSIIYFLFHYESRRLRLPRLLFLCILLTASVIFRDGKHRSISQQRPGNVGVVSLLDFAVILLKQLLAVLQYGLLHISSGFDFGLQFFSQLHFCCVALRICV